MGVMRYICPLGVVFPDLALVGDGIHELHGGAKAAEHELAFEPITRLRKRPAAASGCKELLGTCAAIG
jgi:hypothetical protein